ncbi:MAG: cytochrome P450 [Micromonosporaceae bacterium]
MVDADAILASLFAEDARKDPYPTYAKLRDLGPISPLDKRAPGMTPLVAVATGYDLIDQVLRDPKYYKKRGDEWWDHPILTTFHSSMMFSNPPDHGRMRRVFQKVFTPRRLSVLEPIVHRVADELLDRMADLGADGSELDYVADFAFPMPARVMAEFLGIPDSDLEWYRARVQRVDDYLDLDGKTPERLQAADTAAAELRDYYVEMIANRRRHSRDDLVSALVEANDSGESQMTETELISNLIVLFNASFVTTVHLLGTGLPLLLARPDLTKALPGNLELALDCVHEILRYDSSVQFLIRSAPYDLELGGVPVPKDGSVLLLIAGANRDSERFADADTFQPDRGKAPPLSFGAGLHFCLGAGVTRIEGQVALSKLFQRFPDLKLAGTPVGNGSLFLRGLKHVPIALS